MVYRCKRDECVKAPHQHFQLVLSDCLFKIFPLAGLFFLSGVLMFIRKESVSGQTEGVSAGRMNKKQIDRKGTTKFGFV